MNNSFKRYFVDLYSAVSVNILIIFFFSYLFKDFLKNFNCFISN